MSRAGVGLLGRRGFRRECRKHRLRRMRDHRKQRTRRSARRALALLPVADGLDGNAEPRGEFDLGQLCAAAQIAHARLRGCARFLAGTSGNSLPSRSSTIRPSAFSRNRFMVRSLAIVGMIGQAR